MKQTNAGSFAEAFAAAEQHDEYWTEQAIAEFTEELVRWMELRGMTKAELAQAIGTSQPYVTKVLKGKANFTLATMVKLSRALGARVKIHLAPGDGDESKDWKRRQAL